MFFVLFVKNIFILSFLVIIIDIIFFKNKKKLCLQKQPKERKKRKKKYQFLLPHKTETGRYICIGVDEGLISGTLAKSDFITKLGLDQMDDTELADVKGNISAMVQIGSVGGAALSVLILSYRLWKKPPLLCHVPFPQQMRAL